MRYFMIGAAGHAHEVAWALREQLRAAGDASEILFFDDRVPAGPLEAGLGEVVGPLDAVKDRADADTRLVIGVGLPRVKRLVVERLARLGLPWHTVVDPRAIVGPGATIGEGGYVGAGAIVSVSVRVGAFATINHQCHLAHEVRVGSFTTLHPAVQLSGMVGVGDDCELGVGAMVLPRVVIGDSVVLGAGAVAVESLAAGRTYVGLPAREVVKR